MKLSKKKYQAKKNIEIKKWIETSFIDWEGMIVSTLYVSGCNFRCPFCYNTELIVCPEKLPSIPKENIFLFLEERKSFIDGICLSGGEPTLNQDLPQFLAQIKSIGLKVKLDTNGSHPEVLTDLLEQNLLDYIAMDIKSSLQSYHYSKTIGVPSSSIINRIKASIKLIMNAGLDYEFRTTIVPGFHNDEIIENIGKEIEGAQKYVLQNFIQSEKMLDPGLKNCNPYGEIEMQKMKKKVESYVQKSLIR